MDVKDEIQLAFEELQSVLKVQSQELALYMAKRQEQVFKAAQTGRNWTEVLKQSLVNIKLRAAIDVVETADLNDKIWWDLFWKVWSAGMVSLINQIEDV
jgi:hypothetical protein